MTYEGIANQHLSIQNAELGKGNTAPTQILIANYNGWEFTIGDDSVLDIELPHDLDTSKDIAIHISWFVNEAFATNSGEVQWQLDWSMTPHDETEALDAPTHTGQVLTGDQNIPATAKTIAHDILTIAAASIAEDDTIGAKISRVALVGGNNPTADPTIIAVHVEYIKLPIGK